MDDVTPMDVEGKPASTLEMDVGRILLAASKTGDMATLEPLVNQWSGNAVLNWADPEDGLKTPLYVAARGGHIGVVRLLVDHGADVNKGTNNSWTPLIAASGHGHAEVVKFLIDHKDIEVNKAAVDGWTPVFIAACNGITSVLKVLATNPQVDLNLGGNDGWTPLIYATYSGHIDVVKLLLLLGADPCKRSSDGRSPYSFATKDMIKHMLKAVGGNEK